MTEECNSNTINAWGLVPLFGLELDPYKNFFHGESAILPSAWQRQAAHLARVAKAAHDSFMNLDLGAKFKYFYLVQSKSAQN